LQKNLNRLKGEKCPQQVYESRVIGDNDEISTTPSLQRIEDMGRGTKTIEELMRMEVNLLMRKDELQLMEDELLSKEQDINRKEARLRLLDEEKSINSSLPVLQ